MQARLEQQDPLKPDSERFVDDIGSIRAACRARISRNFGLFSSADFSGDISRRRVGAGALADAVIE
jgi:hypothetical protein